jgi:hypothetical protein
MFFYYSEASKDDDESELMRVKSNADNSILSSVELSQIDKINNVTKKIVLYFDDLIIFKKNTTYYTVEDYVRSLISFFDGNDCLLLIEYLCFMNILSEDKFIIKDNIKKIMSGINIYLNIFTIHKHFCTKKLFMCHNNNNYKKILLKDILLDIFVDYFEIVSLIKLSKTKRNNNIVSVATTLSNVTSQISGIGDQV